MTNSRSCGGSKSLAISRLYIHEMLVFITWIEGVRDETGG